MGRSRGDGAVRGRSRGEEAPPPRRHREIPARLGRSGPVQGLRPRRPDSWGPASAARSAAMRRSRGRPGATAPEQPPTAGRGRGRTRRTRLPLHTADRGTRTRSRAATTHGRPRPNAPGAQLPPAGRGQGSRRRQPVAGGRVSGASPPDPAARGHSPGSTPGRNGSTPTTLRTRTGSISSITRRSPASSHG